MVRQRSQTESMWSDNVIRHRSQTESMWSDNVIRLRQCDQTETIWSDNVVRLMADSCAHLVVVVGIEGPELHPYDGNVNFLIQTGQEVDRLDPIHVAQHKSPQLRVNIGFTCPSYPN